MNINLQKSKAITSRGVAEEVRNEILSIAPIPFVSNLGRYLGFPLKGDRIKSDRFNFLLENIQRKMSKWKSNILNLAGRVCLAKAVIAAIPTYTMQVFYLPRSVPEKTNKNMRSFIWGGSGGKKGWHLVGWKKIIKTKEEGGLGVRDMEGSNTTLLGKAVWSMIHEPGKLWVQVLTNKYLSTSSVLQVSPKANASPIWNGLLKTRDKLRSGFSFRLGNG